MNLHNFFEKTRVDIGQNLLLSAGVLHTHAKFHHQAVKPSSNF